MSEEPATTQIGNSTGPASSTFLPVGVAGSHDDGIRPAAASPPRPWRAEAGQPGAPVAPLGDGDDAHDGAFRPAAAGYGNTAHIAPSAVHPPPSIVDRIKGQVEIIEGKLTSDPSKVAEGEARKTGEAIGGMS